MSKPEMVLDYLQALIWPVLIAVGVWVFRSQLKDLLARVKSVEAAGAKVELADHLGPVKEVLQESVEESREEVAKAENPEQRQRAVDKLEREAAALGRLEAAQEITSAQPVTGAMRELALELGKIAYDDRVTKYVTRVRVAAELAWPRLSAEQQSGVNADVVSQFMKGAREGIPVEETIARLGQPKQFVDAWIEEHGGRR